MSEPRRPWCRLAGVTLVSAVGWAALSPGSPAAPGATAGTPVALTAPDPSAKLAELEKRADALAKQYRGEVSQLTDATNAAKKATAQAGQLQKDLAPVRAAIGELAASRYMTGGIDPSIAVISSDDPRTSLDHAAVVEHLTRNSAARVNQLQSLVNQAQAARQQAQAQMAQLQSIIKDLESKKAQVEQLLNKFRPQSPLVGDRVTPRMLQIRQEVDRRFGPFLTIGCYRANAGEHTMGRACDFMVASGQMPGASRRDQGDRAAAWAIANGSRLGIMYIIWRQRIYDFRTGGGWRAMSDRGGITANHYDHVHISAL